MNVLLSSVGRRDYLVEYFRAAIGPRGKVVATNSVARTPGLLAADVGIVMPEARDPNFIEQMLRVCRDNHIGLLFSLHDWEAPFLADAAECFSAIGVRLGISPPNILNTCLDKLQTDRFCRIQGISTPQTFATLDEATGALEAKLVELPLIVKARHGQGSLALHKVHSEKELAAACVLAEAEIRRCGDNGLGTTYNQCAVIQEFINGDEYGLDVINDFQGRFRACIAKRKLGMRAGETDAAVTVDEPRLRELGERIGTSLGHTAMLDADVIVRAGETYLIEMNPRFGGHYPFSHAAGANVPAALVAWSQGNEEDPEWLNVTAGVRAAKALTMVICGSEDCDEF